MGLVESQESRPQGSKYLLRLSVGLTKHCALTWLVKDYRYSSRRRELNTARGERRTGMTS